MAKGCVHIRIAHGKIINVFSHLSKLPEQGVIHLSVDEVLSDEAFVKGHWPDRNELEEGPQAGVFDLGPDTL